MVKIIPWKGRYIYFVPRKYQYYYKILLLLVQGHLKNAKSVSLLRSPTSTSYRSSPYITRHPERRSPQATGVEGSTFRNARYSLLDPSAPPSTRSARSGFAQDDVFIKSPSPQAGRGQVRGVLGFLYSVFFPLLLSIFYLLLSAPRSLHCSMVSSCARA